MRPLPDSGDWVDATPFRAHVRHLAAATNLSWRAIALYADVPLLTVHVLLHGRDGRPLRRLAPDIARRLLGVHPATLSALTTKVTPVTDTADVVRSMLRLGWTTRDIAARCTLTQVEVAALADTTQGYTSRRIALVVAAVAAAAGIDGGPSRGGQPMPRPGRSELPVAILTS